MQIISINNMHPGNQGVTIYFDAGEHFDIAQGLRLLFDEMDNRTYPDENGVPDLVFRDHLKERVGDLYNKFVELDQYLQSINHNLVLDSEGLADEDKDR